jgi:glucokinase
MDHYSIGVDLGGTKILAGVVDRQTGQVLASAKKKTVGKKDDKGEGKGKKKGNDLASRIAEAVEGALEEAKLPSGASIRGIGIGAAGQVDRVNNVLLFAPNLSVAPNYPLGELLQEEFKLPVYLGNDVEAGTLGELKFGAGAGCADFVCVFVGTGVGSGIVQNGQMRSGATGTAGEIGHMVVSAEGRHCGCGGRGHLEAYSSRTAITRTLLGELKRGRKSILTELLGEPIPDPDTATSAAVRSSIIARAIEAEDSLVKHVVREAAEMLGLGLASVMNFYNPEKIILGGGLIEAVDYFFRLVVEVAKYEALRLPADRIEITRTRLGDSAGLIGAAMLTERQQLK